MTNKIFKNSMDEFNSKMEKNKEKINELKETI